MKPHLVRWHESYAKKGLVIIDVDDGSIDENIEDVRTSFEKHPLPFPVLWDEGGKLNDFYGATEEGTPWTVLIGIDGEIKWKGPPLKKLEEIEAAIEAELGRME